MPWLVAALPSILVSAAIAGISYAIQTALAPKVPKGDLSTKVDRFRTIQRSTVSPARRIFGAYRASGVLAFSQSCNEEGEPVDGGPYLHLCLMMAEGPVWDIVDVQLNDQSADDPQFRDLTMFVPMMGFPDQKPLRPTMAFPSDPNDPIKLPLEWTSKNRAVSGIAYLWGTLKHDPKNFPGGAPNIKATILGSICYDPREDVTLGGAQSIGDRTTWRYTTNLALCIRFYATDPSTGAGYPHDMIDDDMIIIAANKCDEMVDTSVPLDQADLTKGYVQEKRYTCGGPYETDQKPIEIMAMLLAAGAATFQLFEGLYRLEMGAAASVATDIVTGQPIIFDDTTTRGAVEVIPKPGRKTRVNTIRGTFINPAKDWLPDAFRPVTNSTFLKQDRKHEHSVEMDFPFTQSEHTARRLASIELNRERQSIRVKWPAQPKMMQVRPWSVVLVTHADYGWVQKKFRVTDREMDATAALTFLLEEYADSIYTDFKDGVPYVDDAPDSNLPDPFKILPPADVAAFEETFTLPDGTRAARIVVNITPPADGIVDGFRVRYRLITTEESLPYQERRVRSPEASMHIAPADPGVYEVAVASTLRDLVSAEVLKFPFVTYKTLPPPDVTDFRFQIGPLDTRIFTWTLAGPAPADLAGYEIRYLPGRLGQNLTTEWDRALVLGANLTRSPFETRNPITPGDYTFYVRAIDRSGFYSNGVAFLQATIPLPRGEVGVVFLAEASEQGWPGDRINCIVNEFGALETYDPTLTWDTLPATWNLWTQFVVTPATGVYVYEIIELAQAGAYIPSVDLTVENGTATVLVQSSLNRDDWTTYQPIGSSIDCKLLRVGVVVVPDGSGKVPLIREFHIRVAQAEEEEAVNDIDTAVQTVVSVGRVFFDAPSWSDGWLQFDTALLENPFSPDIRSVTIRPAWSSAATASAYAVAPHVADLNLSRSFTIKFRMRSSVVQSDKHLLAKGSQWGVYYPTHGTFQFRAVGYTGDNPNGTTSQIVLPDGTLLWNEIAYVYDGRTLFGYLNAVEQFRRPLQFTLASGSSALSIAALAAALGSGTNQLDGMLREISVWNVALSQEQLANLLARPLTVQEYRRHPGLVAYYPGDEASGTVLNDLSRLRNHATWNAAPTRSLVATMYYPAFMLDAVGSLFSSAIAWHGAVPGSSAIQVSYRLGSAGGGPAAWVVVPLGSNLSVSALNPGQDLIGETLYVRALMTATSIAQLPQVDLLAFSMRSQNRTGDHTYIPQRRFARINSVTFTAVQNASGPIDTRLVHKHPSAVRFQLRDQLGAAVNAVVDMTLRGPALTVNRRPVIVRPS